MIQLIALVAAIALVIALQTLRALLALPFARQRARHLGAIRPPAPLAALFDQAHAELIENGFDGPDWYLCETVGADPGPAPLRAMYRHRESSTWLMLVAPINMAAPHLLHSTFASRLKDGGVLLSQPFEPYYAATSTERVIGQCLKYCGFATQLDLHQRWVAEHGQADPDYLQAAGAMDLLVELPERHRQELIERGDLRAQNADLATATIGFAWRLWRAYRSRPHPPADPRPVPAARLALLAAQVDRVSERSPPKPVQWQLFGVSVLLFMLLGWLLWDAQFALLLLVVIVFHEAGHFLAMRAFGYRNVHMLLLPLVGGVAIGQDLTPNSWRRAWMSLMGPLPGIVLGWILMFALWGDPQLDGSWPWLSTLAWLLLFINYLNVLPVPPLDGSHVVQALLPPRLAWLQVGFVAIAAVVGGVIAWWLDFKLLTGLAALQLLTLGGRWQVLQAGARLVEQIPRDLRARGPRLTAVYQGLERMLGPAAAATRLAQGREVLQMVDTQAMRGWQSATIGSVYALLLAVPLLAIAVYADVISSSSSQAAYLDYHYDSDDESMLQQAAELPLNELLRSEYAVPESTWSPASAEQIAAAEARLGRSLPTELVEFYRVSNGAEHLSLAPIEQIGSAKASVQKNLAPYMEELTLWLDETEEPLSLALPELENWWWLGEDFDGQTQIFYDPGDPVDNQSLPGVRLIHAFIESPGGHASLRDYLQSSWVAERMSELQGEQMRRAIAAGIEELREESTAELIGRVDALSEPGWSVRLMMVVFASGADLQTEVAAPAAEADLAAAQARFGPLPITLRELYLSQNGIPWLSLGNVENADRLQNKLDNYAEDLELHLHQCIDLSWHRDYGEFEHESDLRPQMPTLLWCDESTAEPGLHQLHKARRYDDPRQWLLNEVATRVFWFGA